MAKLTTTSYAILGLLERRPWSAYELTKYMQRSGIRAVWPRTESRIYIEFKNLLAHGLATATEETKQRRKRSVYRITPDGRKQFKQWLRCPEGTLRLESEPLLKLLYSDLDAASSAIQLDHLHSCLLDEAKVMHRVITEALEEGFMFEENAIHNARLATLLTNILEARSRWLTQTIEESNSSRDAKTEHGPDQAKKIYRREAKRLERLIAGLES